MLIDPTRLVSTRGRSCDQSACSSAVILECRWDLLLRFIVASKTVNTGLDENEAEFGVLVLAVGLQVLANRYSLLHQVP